MSDGEWHDTLARVRGEFEEMRCLRLTRETAPPLLGLAAPASIWVLERLTDEGFLARTPQGEYMRRTERP